MINESLESPTAVVLGHRVPPRKSWWICSTREQFMIVHRQELPRMMNQRLPPGVEAALNQIGFLTTLIARRHG